MVLLFGVVIFLAAALLFAVQPMAAKTFLPLLGGGPSVWTTSMLFFQALLLCGYLYAHLLSTRLRPGAQAIVHALVLTAALALAGVFGGRPASVSIERPELALLWLLAVTVGPVFFAVSSAGPLLQSWFGRIGHGRSRDPYFLYSASNAGSFVGLLAYPLVIEPSLALPAQRWAWLAGFGVFALLAVVCGLRAASAPGGPEPADGPTHGPGADGPPAHEPRRERWRWGVLAFIPSSLLLGVTTLISTDVAAFPLLWVVPLAIYLASLVLGFGRLSGRLDERLRLPAACAIAGTVALLAASQYGLRPPAPLTIALHLSAQAVISTWLHARLARARPAVARLTEYYIVIAVGGAVGGLVHALLAPRLFPIPLEYHLTLIGAGLMLPWGVWGRRDVPDGVRRRRVALLLVPLVAGGLAFVPDTLQTDRADSTVPVVGVLGLGAVLTLAVARDGLVFGLAAGLQVAVAVRMTLLADGVIYLERTFYGTHSVVEEVLDGHLYRELMHGTTTHGAQLISESEAFRKTPLMYYHRDGPVGELLTSVRERGGPLRIAVLGLGTGALASYGQADDDMVFYEIDDAVIRIARDMGLFTYLADSDASIRVVRGDARVELAAQPQDERYDLIVVDAFSSDSIPVHLMTSQAAGLYASRLRPGGIVAMHVSNRILDLDPVAANALNAAGLVSLIREDVVDLDEGVRTGRTTSIWVAGTAERALVTRLAQDGWLPVAPYATQPTWTDDFSDVVGVMRW